MVSLGAGERGRAEARAYTRLNASTLRGKPEDAFADTVLSNRHVNGIKHLAYLPVGNLGSECSICAVVSLLSRREGQIQAQVSGGVLVDGGIAGGRGVTGAFEQRAVSPDAERDFEWADDVVGVTAISAAGIDDLELRTQEYVLTGDEEQRLRIRYAATKEEERVVRLKALTMYEPSQQDRVEALRLYTQVKLTELGAEVEARHEAGAEPG